MAEITLESGSKIKTFPQPPPVFDPLTASPAELLHYGFPPRSDDPNFSDRYRRVWRRIKDRYRYVEPKFEIDPKRPPRPRKPIFGLANPSWSGGVVFPPGTQSFCGLQGEWVLPNVYPPSHNEQYNVAFWIGLDGVVSGAGANELLQAGVAGEVYVTHGELHRDLYPWFEWVPGDPVKITNLPISPGDLLTIALSTPNGNGSTTATLHFFNLTDGASTSLALSAPLTPSPVQLVGNSAEWIVEAPLQLQGVDVDTLPDFGEVFFSHCEAYIAGGGSINGGTGTALNMVFDGAVISEGVLLSPSIIQCSYVGPQP